MKVFKRSERNAERPVTDAGHMTLVEHIEELRSRLIKCAIAVAIGVLAGWILYPQIFDVLVGPYNNLVESLPEDAVLAGGRLLITDPLEGFSIRIKIATYVGIGFAMPVILWQLWRFVTPGLYPHEKRYAVPFVVSALVLFLLGAGLAFWTLPRALQFLISIGGEGLTTALSPAKYFTLITYMMLAFGLGFEFPILLIFLQMAGIIDHTTLAKGRRYAIVAIVVIVAVITPSGDPYSLMILSIPMYVFYEASIVIGRILSRRRGAADAHATA